MRCSNKIDNLILCMFICLVAFNFTYAQSKFQINIQGDLYSFPISKTSKEFGPGYYNVSGKNKVNEAFYLDCNYMFHKNIGVYIGAGLHSYNYEIDYVISDPVFGRPDIFNESRVLNAISWSPTIGAIFRKGAFSFRINVAEFDPIKTDNSVGSSYATHLIFEESQTDPILILSIDEKIKILGDPGAYQMLQFSFQYNITKSIYFNVGYESALNSGRLFHYRLLIKEINNSNPSDEIIRNDYRITSKYNAITLGLGYQFNFGKS